MSSTDRLLREMTWGVLTAKPYSRKSAYGRLEPLLRATAMAILAVVTGVALGSPAPARPRAL